MYRSCENRAGMYKQHYAVALMFRISFNVYEASETK